MAILSTRKEMRKFDTGAVRDSVEGKGRCDLLPLGIIAILRNDPIYKDIDNYIYSGDEDCLAAALDKFVILRYQGCWETALLEVAKRYEDGARKYSDRNWEKGMGLHWYIDSGVRHYIKFKRGDKDEPHDRAFVWNLLGALFTQQKYPELCDLPFAKKETKDT